MSASIFSLGAQKKEKIMNKSDSDKDEDIQWNLRDLLKISQCLLTINIQRLPCTVIKFHVVMEGKEEAKEAVLYFVKDF